MLNQKVFIEGMSVLSDLYDKKLSKATLKLYYEVLAKKLNTNQFLKAIEKWIEKEKFFPRPAELIEAVEKEEGNQAETAWLEVIKEIERVGIHGQPYFNDKTIYAVIQAMGGWDNLCNMPENQQNFYFKQFKEFYNVYKEKREVLENALPESRTEDAKVLASLMKLALEKQNTKQLGDGK